MLNQKWESFPNGGYIKISKNTTQVSKKHHVIVAAGTNQISSPNSKNTSGLWEFIVSILISLGSQGLMLLYLIWAKLVQPTVDQHADLVEYISLWVPMLFAKQQPEKYFLVGHFFLHILHKYTCHVSYLWIEIRNAPNISLEERFHFGLADPAKNHNVWISWVRLEKKKHHVIALAKFSVIKCHLVLKICFLIPSTWTKDSLLDSMWLPVVAGKPWDLLPPKKNSSRVPWLPLRKPAQVRFGCMGDLMLQRCEVLLDFFDRRVKTQIKPKWIYVLKEWPSGTEHILCMRSICACFVTVGAIRICNEKCIATTWCISIW